MFNFDNFYTTKKTSPWTNTCQFIIIHHTGSGTYLSNCKYLSTGAWIASVQFVVGEEWQAAKIGEPRNIMRHAGESERGTYKSMNQYALGIEVVWPDKDGWFSDKQYTTLVKLVKHLMATFSIPKENVLKHSDITWGGSKEMKLWDGKSPARKTDISPTLWNRRWYKNFAEWRQKVL